MLVCWPKMYFKRANEIILVGQMQQKHRNWNSNSRLYIVNQIPNTKSFG